MQDDLSHRPLSQNTQQHDWVLYILSFVFVLMTMFLLYKVPFNGDDAVNCMTGGALDYNHRTLWEHTFMLFKNWLNAGRLYPLAFYSYALFTYLPSLFAYRTFMILLNMIVIASFGVLVRYFTKSAAYTAASMILIPVFIQYRYYQDPMLAYHGMVQFVALYIIWAIYLQIYGIEKKKAFAVILSSLLFACSLLTYEIAYPFIIVFIAAAIYRGKKKGCFAAMLPHILVTAVILAITFYFRIKASNTVYPGIGISWDISRIAFAFISQISAAFPLSYWIVCAPPYLTYNFMQFIQAVTLWDVFLTLFLSGMLLYIFLRLPKKKIPKSIVFYGLAFWLLPACVISLSLRYQTELTPGVGHLPVYLQYFGGVLIALAVLSFIFEHCKKKSTVRILAVIFAACFSVGFLINNVNNRQIKNVFAENNSQSLTTSAMDNGFLKQLNDNDSVIILGGGCGLTCDPACFICQYCDGLKITSKTLQMLVEENKKKPAVQKKEQTKKGSGSILYPENLYVYQCTGDLTSGTALLGKVVSITYDPAAMTITQVTVSEMEVYLCNAGKGALHFDSLLSDGSVIRSDMEVSDIFSEPDAAEKTLLPPAGSNGTIGMTIKRVTHVTSMTGLDRIFGLDQEKVCRISISTDGIPIIFTSAGVSNPD